MVQPATDWLNSDAVKQAIPAVATLLGSGLTLFFTHLGKRGTEKSNLKIEAFRHDREQGKALAAKKSEVAADIISAISATETALAKYTALYRGGDLNFFKPVVTDELRPKLNDVLIGIGNAVDGCIASKPLVEILGGRELINSFELYKTNLVTFNRLIRLPQGDEERSPDAIQTWHSRIDGERFALLSLLRPIYLGEMKSQS
jgi:hypothetical protein